MEEVTITVRDGTQIGAAIYAPENGARLPAVLAASPYRYDNNVLPAGPQFLWRETGPIDFYVKNGYAYVHMDVRGSGKSGGEFEFLGPNEQRDLYDVIQWITQQPWSNGKVGGLGQSYFCLSQWWMGVMAPPGLACLAAYDGLNDPYRATCYQGGIPGQFMPGYWWNQNRIINRSPANGAAPREQKTDLDALISAHPTYDDFWRARSAWERLGEITVPLYSIGIWGKIDLHTRGNIDGFRRAKGPRKLQMRGPPNAWAANQEFNSVELHEKVLLPFYDRYLKGKETEYDQRAPVEYFLRGANEFRSCDTWPPPGVHYKAWYLRAGPSGSVTSLNDGALADSAAEGIDRSSYKYPNPGWVTGVVGFGPAGPAGGFDPVRRVLTFTTAPLDTDLDIAGPIKLVLYASSSGTDTDFIVKLAEQYPQSAEDRAKGLSPASQLVTKGWLRASHRALDAERSTEMEPYHTHTHPEPIKPGEVYKFEISIEPNAYRFKKGNRIRLEIVNGDSPVTDVLWTHYYAPNKMGEDTIWHSAKYPSALFLPVL
ncbi:MAG: CocE/NonD family hydrolase [Betaproteobacteria bacterium]|nr:CocE/NonD family hydrolase [Betaproteobacteria bacterium]